MDDLVSHTQVLKVPLSLITGFSFYERRPPPTAAFLEEQSPRSAHLLSRSRGDQKSMSHRPTKVSLPGFFPK